MPKLAPVLVFTYDRPAHTRATLLSLAACELASESELLIFSDGARTEEKKKAVAAVREIFPQVTGFKSVRVFQREENFGLARSIIEGVSSIITKYGSVIVLEDDLELAPGFLVYMNEGLARFQADPRIFSLSGWAPRIRLPDDYRDAVYFSQRALCWGWASWADRWRQVDWQIKDYDLFSSDKSAQKRFASGGDDLPDMLRNYVQGKNNSWAIRWTFAQHRLNSYSVVPALSYVINRGQDDSGENSRKKYILAEQEMNISPSSPVWPDRIEPDARILELLRRFYGYNWKAKIRRALNML